MKKQLLFCFVFFCLGITAFGQAVTTLAGSVQGCVDGTSTAAQFYFPDGIAVDVSGNVYVADVLCNRIRKITPAGVVSTLAGAGFIGSADGQGIAAQFYFPTEIAVDASGNLYVWDSLNLMIRKITPAGLVSTFAGSGEYGYADGTGTAAQFTSINGIAVDATGTLYVADAGNHKIRKITSAGVVSTFAGSTQGYADGTGIAAQFNNPGHLAIDILGNVYVIENANNRIRKITPAGVVSTLAGSSEAYADGTFISPYGIAVDLSGTLYVVDNNRIKQLTPEGVVTNFAGSEGGGYADGTGTAAHFNGPRCIAVDASGTLYVTDKNNSKIRKITKAQNLSSSILSGTAAICSGNSANLNVAITGGYSPYTVVYNNGVADITVLDYVSGANIPVSPTSTTTYTLVSVSYANSIEGIGNSGTAIITVNSVPVVPIASAQTFCGSATVANLTATGAAKKWYVAPSGGNPLTTSIALATGTYYVTQTLSGCESDRTAVSVIVTTAPQATTPQVFSGTGTLANLTATGTNLQWYASITGGTPLENTTALINGTIYYVNQTVNGCVSTRTAVTVQKISESNQTFCGATTVANINSMPSTGTSTRWFTTDTGGTALASTDALSTGSYYVEQYNNEAIDGLGTGFNATAGVGIQADGKILVADTNNNAIKRMNADGTGIVTLGAGFNKPNGVTVQADGKILVADTFNNAIKRMNTNGTSIVTLGAGFIAPYGVAVQADGKILVADTSNNAVKRMNADGTGIVTLGTGFNQPTCIAVQPDGKILVVDSYNLEIKRMNADGTGIVTLWSGILFPSGIAVLGDGKIVVSFPYENAIKLMNTDGTGIVTIGNGFSQPNGLAIQPDGKILVADSNNNAIKGITLASQSNRVAVNVTVNTTAAPTASAQTFCGSATVASLTATGTAIQWYANATGGSTLATSTALATATYYVSQTENSCESPRTAVSETVNPVPLAPTASTQTFCNSATVANLTATGTAIQWYAAATGGNALVPSTALATATYYATQTINSCESARRAVNVNITVTAAPTVVTPQVYTSTGTIANLSATGTSLQWYAANTGVSPLVNTTALTNGYNYYVSQTFNACESARTAVTVQKISESSQIFCGSATVANLISTPSTGTTAHWFTTNAGGTALANSTALNTSSYYVEQYNNDVVATLGAGFNTPLGIAVQADGKILVTDANNNAIKRMNADGTGIETLGSGFNTPYGVAVQTDGKILIADSFNSAIKRMNADGTGIQTLGEGFLIPTRIAIQADGKILVADNNNNAIKRMNADGTGIETLGAGFNYPTDVAVQSDGKILVADTSNNSIKRMNADGTGIETLGSGFNTPYGIAIQPDGKILVVDSNNNVIKRMNADGTGIVTLDIVFNLPADVALQADGKILVADYGTNTIKQITEGSLSNRVAVNVTVNTTAAPTASAQTFCGSATVASLTATGTAIQWYTAATGGSALATSTALATATYYASQTQNSCESTRTTVSVTVNSVPTAPTTSAQTFCGSATVASLTATGTAIQWYANATGGSALATSTALATATYYASQTVDGCESARTAVSITLNTTIPSAPTVVTPQVYTGTGTIANLTATGTGLHWYAANTGGLPLVNTTALTNGSIYYVSQTLSACESTRTAVTVNKISESSQTFCGATAVGNLNSTPSTGTTARWFSTSTGSTALTSTDALTTGSYYVEQYNNETVTTLEPGFNNPTALAVQSDGKILVADTYNNVIKRMNADGTGIETLGAGFSSPNGVAVQADGKILVADSSNNAIKRMNADGTGIITLAEGFSNPMGLVVQTDGKILVADINNNAIKRMNADGTGIETLGAGFSAPFGVAVQSDGKILVADYNNNAIKRMNNDGTGIETLGTGFNYPTGVAVQSDGKIVVSDSFNNAIKRMNADGTGIVTLGSGFLFPVGVAVQTNGNIFVSEPYNNSIKHITEGRSSNRVAVNITVNTTAAPTAAAQNLNVDSTVANLAATGSNLKWYSAATGGTVIATNTVLTSGTYYVSQTVNGCESSRTAVTITLSNSSIPTSKVNAVQCGTTLSALSANINADYVAGYQAYRFEVTNGAIVHTVEVNKYNFSLTQTPGITYSTTYGVRVAVKKYDTWGAYGVSCNVTTPALAVNVIPTTTIKPSLCGTTLATLDTKIGATPISAATGYRFEITKGGVTTVFDTSVYNFRLTDAGVAAYGTTYSIRVAVLVNGVYGNFGASCNVSTPILTVNTVPTTTIQPSFCGATLAALDTKIGAVLVAGATKARFEVTIAGGSSVVYEVAAYNFKLSQAGVAVLNNTSYSIRVAVLVNGVWGNFGAACTVTTPAATIVRLKAKSFEVSAYPNPFETAFHLSLETANKEEVTIAVYDMMGKLVETHQVNPIEVAYLQIGNNFAAGIYNVVVSQANEMQTIRLIRK